MRPNSTRNYGLLITNEVRVINNSSLTSISGAISFWVCFTSNGFDNQQTIAGLTTSTNFNIIKAQGTNEIIFRNGTTITLQTGIIVEPNKLYYFAAGYAEGSSGYVLRDLSIVINNQHFSGFGFIGIAPVFGGTNASFALFSVNLFNRDYRLGLTPINYIALKKLYNNGYPLPNPNTLGLNQTLTNGLLITLSSNSIDNGSLQITNGTSSSNTPNNLDIGLASKSYIAYLAINGSLVKALFDSCQEWQPIVIGNEVFFRHNPTMFDANKSNNLTDYVYEGLVCLNVSNVFANSDIECPESLQEITLASCTVGQINNFKGRSISLSACSGVLQLNLLNGILFTLTASNVSMVINNPNMVVLNPSITTCQGTYYEFNCQIRNNLTITNNSNYFTFKSGDVADKNNLSHQKEIVLFFVTSFNTNSGINTVGVDNFSNPLDFSGCTSLADIRISNGDRLYKVILPSMAKLTRLDLTNIPLAGIRLENLDIHYLTLTRIDIKSSVPFAENLDFSTYVNLTHLSISSTGTLTVPENNKITYLGAESGITSLNRISTAITGLYLRNNNELTGVIDLSQHAVNMGDGCFLGNCNISGIILPTTSGRTISRFRIDGNINCPFPTLPNWTMFPDSSGSAFQAGNTDHSNINAAIPIGTVIRSRSIDIAQTDISKKMPIAHLRATFEHLYVNINNMANNTIAKFINARHPDIIGALRTPTLIAGAGYIQANANTVGADGINTANYNAATDQAKISHIAFVLINQNTNNTVLKKYNFNISL